MSGRSRILLFLLVAVAGMWYLRKQSTEKWGKTVNCAIVEKHKPTGSSIGDSRNWRYKLDNPPEARFQDFTVPEEAWNRTSDSDHLLIEIQAIPFLKAEAVHFEQIRANGEPVYAWSEGLIPFWVKLAGVCLGAAFGLQLLLALLMKALGYGGVVKD